MAGLLDTLFVCFTVFVFAATASCELWTIFAVGLATLACGVTEITTTTIVVGAAYDIGTLCVFADLLDSAIVVVLTAFFFGGIATGDQDKEDCETKMLNEHARRQK